MSKVPFLLTFNWYLNYEELLKIKLMCGNADEKRRVFYVYKCPFLQVHYNILMGRASKTIV